MSESPSDQVGDSPAVDLTGKIMVVIIIILFMIVVTALAVHLYAKVFFQSRPRSVAALGTGNGLDPSVLKSLHVSVFQPQDSSSKENGVECSVCLSELVEGEKLRVLPKCNHGFHVDCIDMWFQSHATCPLCRTLVVASQPNGDLESQSFPTNVLIWGHQTQITSTTTAAAAAAALKESTSSNTTTSTTSRRDGMLVIDIPGHHGGEEETSPSSPVIRRLRSLRRLLSNRLNPWTPTSSTQTTKGEQGHS